MQLLLRSERSGGGRTRKILLSFDVCLASQESHPQVLSAVTSCR